MTTKDNALIDIIITRANTKLHIQTPLDRFEQASALCRAHEICPLRLQDFASASDFDFTHDYIGIMQHIDPQSFRFVDDFLPRFASNTKRKLMTFDKFTNLMREYVDTLSDATSTHPLVGYIVFKPSSFHKLYSLASRTYRVNTTSKWFISSAGGMGLFGDCLDGSDQGVRLDAYMDCIHGGADGWHVDYCYISTDEEDM